MKKITVLVLIFAYALLNNVYSQDNKTVTITVTGDGITQKDALQSALRNAIEQAYGTFISSNTQILNDELIKDEIVSISSGNIQEYNIISEILTTPQNWNTTVKAKISIDKLTSFCENKGVKIEFKGALFAINVIQQNINEENELVVIENAIKIVHELFDKAFDFEIKAGEPTGSNRFKIPLTISVRLNNNFVSATDYLFKTLNGLSLTAEEIANYTTLHKPVTPVAFAPFGANANNTQKVNNKKNKKDKDLNTNANNLAKIPQIFYLRNFKSMYSIIDCIQYLLHSTTNFAVKNDIETLVFKEIYDCENDIHYRVQFNTSFFNPILYNQSYLTFFPRDNDGCRDIAQYYKDNDYKGYLKDAYYMNEKEKARISSFYFMRVLNWNAGSGFGSVHKSGEFFINPEDPNFKKFSFVNSLDVKPTIWWGGNPDDGITWEAIEAIISFAGLNVGDIVTEINFEDYKTLDELSKISGYSIAPLNN